MSQAIPPLSAIDKILIVKTSSIGDVVHALPVVESLKKNNPKLDIGWVVKERCASVLTGNPNINRLHIVPNHAGLGDIMRIRKELVACRYQCALDMQGLFMSGVYTWLSGAPVRVGIDRNRECNAVFLTHPIIPGAPERHAVDILYGFAALFSIHAQHPEFVAQPYLASGSENITAEVKRSGEPRIAIVVGASSDIKKWPVDYWITLSQRLIKDGCTLVFVGNKKDAETVASIKKQLPDNAGVVDFSGRTTLRELAAVLAECRLAVSADTGPMHMAVAVGTPVIAIFGSTNPDLTGPYGTRNVVLDARLPCAPCFRKPTCEGRVDCMKAVQPGDVYNVIAEKLAVRN